MVTYKRSYSYSYNRSSSFKLSHRILPRSKYAGRSRCWTRVLVVGVMVFSVYFLLLGFISYIAISSHRNAGVSGSSPYYFQLMHKNGSLLDVDYDLLRSGNLINGTLVLRNNNGLIGLDRLGNIQFNSFARRAGVLGAEVLHAQLLFQCTPTPIHFLDNTAPEVERRPAVALVSFPGSGNTWLRYLLQLATGIFTGSVYKDFALLRNGFPGEYIKDGRVLVVKTHETGPVIRANYQKAILLIRKPQEAILAEFNRRHGGHLALATRDKFRRSEGRLWSQFVALNAQSWSETNLDWIENFQGPLLIITYTQVVANVSSELRTVLDFIQESVSDKVMACVLRNQEGIFHRPKKPLRFNPFTATMLRILAKQEQMVSAAIEKRTSTKRDQIHRKAKVELRTQIENH